MAAIPQPSAAEVLESVAVAISSADPTVRELLKTLVMVTRVVHRPTTFWSGLPEFGER